eukprot:CAMPEP_0168535156 /NCGR_PEP_ID=MMETSP0405-20121227/18469_1 /TAXON_ID=498012 /ORGANISM="Trichosphaerium sp, Strain Am-I-7 wt" /LENGTH=152 /DNA_ID=CAMNT_0008562283 /DNA_START=136 /DNA_END=594 /DNA_ORIENTATION=-
MIKLSKTWGTAGVVIVSLYEEALSYGMEYAKIFEPSILEIKKKGPTTLVEAFESSDPLCISETINPPTLPFEVPGFSEEGPEEPQSNNLVIEADNSLDMLSPECNIMVINQPDVSFTPSLDDLPILGETSELFNDVHDPLQDFFNLAEYDFN